MLKRYLYPVIMLSALNACTEGNEKKNESDVKPVIVTLSTASKITQSVISASGIVEATHTADISTRVMGRITGILVKSGDTVKKGQLLATVWAEDIKAKRGQADALIAEAENRYVTAQRDYHRYYNLYRQQSATEKELDNATLQYNAAKAAVAAANQTRSEINANLSYGNLTAPFTGVVTQKLAEAGSIASPGMPILTIESNSSFQVAATVTEADISRIHVGDIATIHIKSTGKLFDGKIIQVNPSSQFSGGQYVVKISIPETVKNEIYAGMFAGVNIRTSNRVPVINDVLMIPASAVINRDELKGIYTVSVNNTALLRWVRLGKMYGDNVEVISGLSGNEQFIRSSNGRLYNGVPVVVKEMPVATTVTINKL